MILVNSLVSIEAIAHQGRSKLFSDLIVSCAELRERVRRVGFDDCNNCRSQLENIEATIKKHTNLSISLNILKSKEVNAQVNLQQFGLNHPFFKWIHDIYGVSEGTETKPGDTINYIVKKAKDSTGWINRKESKVYGIYTSFEFKMAVNYGTIVEFLPENIASIILHEIGHTFTQLEYLTGLVVQNYALSTISQSITQANNIDEKVKFIHTVKEAFNLQSLDVEEASKSKNKEVLSTYFLESSIKPYYSTSGNYMYDSSGAEYLADQFASRHGAGMYLVYSLDKMHYGYPEKSSFARFIGNALTILITLGTFGLPLVMILLLSSLVPYEPKIYDSPKDRIKRIKDQLIDSLKDPNLDSVDKVQISTDIRNMEDIMKQYTPFENILDKFANFVVGSRRKAKENKSFQQIVEDLSYPKLLTTAVEFELQEKPHA